LFWFSTTTKVFAAIRRYHPFAVDTSEARLMRRWLERRGRHSRRHALGASSGSLTHAVVIASAAS